MLIAIKIGGKGRKIRAKIFAQPKREIEHVDSIVAIGIADGFGRRRGRALARRRGRTNDRKIGRKKIAARGKVVLGTGIGEGKTKRTIVGGD